MTFIQLETIEFSVDAFRDQRMRVYKAFYPPSVDFTYEVSSFYNDCRTFCTVEAVNKVYTLSIPDLFQSTKLLAWKPVSPNSPRSDAVVDIRE